MFDAMKITELTNGIPESETTMWKISDWLRMIKAEGLKIAVLLGNNDVFCRMYRTFDEAVVGFSRNIHEYFGGRRAVMLAFWFIICFGPFIVFFASGWTFLGLFVLMVFANRVFISAACRQNVFLSVLLHPLQMISFTAVRFLQYFQENKKRNYMEG